MPEKRIVGFFRVRSRFLRSVQLDRDFADPRALDSYVLTAQNESYARRLISGLRPGSGQRAWRITGDYGSGKSSFALLLAHLLSDKYVNLPSDLRHAIDFKKIGIDQPRLLPILVTGSPEPLSDAILQSLHRDLLAITNRRRAPAIINEIEKVLHQRHRMAVEDEVVLRLLNDAAAYVVRTERASGLLLLLDELGKFLEYGALRPDRQDVFLLQRLAETATRSGKRPLFVVGLLHQGFNAYAQHLSQSAQREWEKVAGRFDEVLFNQPLEDTAALVSGALNVRTDKLPGSVIVNARRDMRTVIQWGWYGGGTSNKRLTEIAATLYPLHGSVLPVLVKLFSRFGQNERSLFSFLLSPEPFGLQEFANYHSVQENEFYRIHNLYDYARAAFGQRLALQSFHTHWNQIESLVESFPEDEETELRVLKTVGLLNLLDAENLLPTDSAIEVAVGGHGTQVKTAIRKLKAKKVLYFRGTAGGNCLWPHTSVNLNKAYDDASRALGPVLDSVAILIQTYLETRPLVARRHYIETGNLRHFEVLFARVEDLAETATVDFDRVDGRIIVALCESEEERQEALTFAQSIALKQKPEILIAIPHPLRILSKLVQELQRWEWVAANTPALNNDQFAAEEVSRQVSAARQALEQRVHSIIGLQRFADRTELKWFHRSERVDLLNGRDVLAYLSTICDMLYAKAPKVANELVNRRVLSSAAAAARMRLIEGIFAASSKPYLGMDPSRKPPEMSVYLSVLAETGLHQEEGDDFVVVLPAEKDDSCHLRPALLQILAIVEGADINRVKVSDIFSVLKRPPFGVRDGINPILLAVFAVIYQQHVAFYENGRFMREIVGLDLMRLTKLPQNFEIQYCKPAGIRSELFKKLLLVLVPTSTTKDRLAILDVVRPLCEFAAHLTPYAKKTRNLSPVTDAVRTALLQAQEPATLLFRQLPEACGFAQLAAQKNSNSKLIDQFVISLKTSLEELRMLYPELQERMKTELLDAFECPSDFKLARMQLAKRAETLLPVVSLVDMRAFCNRLSDCELSDSDYLESLGSLLCASPPSRWSDLDLERYFQEIRRSASRFRRIETMAFESGLQTDRRAMRVCMTRVDGHEVDDVVHFSENDELAISLIEKKIDDLLASSGRLGIAAAVRSVWKSLSDSEGTQ